VIQRLDGSLAAAHDLADFSIGKVFHELQDQERLTLWREIAYHVQKGAGALLFLHGVLWAVPYRQRVQFIQTSRDTICRLLRSRCQLATRLCAILYNHAENGSPLSS